MNYNFLYQKLSGRIEHLRKQKELAQEQLAERSGFRKAYFWNIENGRNISVKTVCKIVRALEVTLSDLFNFE